MPEVYDALGNGDREAGFDAMNAMSYDEAVQHASSSIACIDCHDPQTMELTITRPAFVEGIKQAKAAEGVPDYDVNRDATNQEMRTYVCAQCHVEYYFAGEGKTLTFPWKNGLTVYDAMNYYDEVAAGPTSPTRRAALRRSRRSTPTSRPGRRASTRPTASPAPTATCRTTARVRRRSRITRS